MSSYCLQMIDYCLWLCVITLVQLSLVYLWFDSAILSPVFNWCLSRKRDKWYTWFTFTLLTCPQCLGYWLAWLSAAAGYFVPGSPLQGHNIGYVIWLVFFTGLAVAVLSRLIDGFMPEPINQKLYIHDYDDSLESVESTEEVISDNTDEQSKE